MSKSTLFETIDTQEQEEIKAQQPKKRPELCTPQNSPEKKRFTIYTRIDLFDKFNKINKARGISTNAVWNMLMTDYINEYEHLI